MLASILFYILLFIPLPICRMKWLLSCTKFVLYESCLAQKLFKRCFFSLNWCCGFFFQFFFHARSFPISWPATVICTAQFILFLHFYYSEQYQNNHFALFANSSNTKWVITHKLIQINLFYHCSFGYISCDLMTSTDVKIERNKKKNRNSDFNSI